MKKRYLVLTGKKGIQLYYGNDLSDAVHAFMEFTGEYFGEYEQLFKHNYFFAFSDIKKENVYIVDLGANYNFIDQHLLDNKITKILRNERIKEILE